MKKIAIYLIFSVVTVVFAVLNLTVTSNNKSGIDLIISKIEAVASNPEWGGWRNFSKGQGFWKNEREKEFECPRESSQTFKVSLGYKGMGLSFEIGREQTNPQGNGAGVIGTGQTNPQAHSAGNTGAMQTPQQVRKGIECGLGDSNCTPVSC